MQPRKTLTMVERILAEAGSSAPRPVMRAAALAVIANPFAGRFVEDLSALFDIGMRLGEDLMPKAVALLDGPPVAYGKSAIVGVNGGGEAIIPSTTKVAAAGTIIDVPLANKDNIWSFDELDCITLFCPDAPRPNEILVIMAVADGGRPHPRVGKGRAAS